MEPDLIKTSNPVFKKAISPPSPWEKFLSIFKIHRGVNSTATQTLNEVIQSQKFDKQELIQKSEDKENIKKSIEKEVDIIISLEDTNLLIKFLNSGYSLNKQQAEKVIIEKQNIWTIQPNLEISKKVIQLLSLNKNIIEDIFLEEQDKFIHKVKDLISSKLKEEYPSTSRDEVGKYEARFLSHLDSQNKILSSFSTIFSENVEKLHQAIEVFQNTSLLLIKERNWNTSVFDKLNARNNLSIDHLKKRYIQYTEHIEQKLQQSEMIYLAQSIDNDFNARIKDKTKNFGPKVIPAPSWEITQGIQKLISEIDVSKLVDIARLDYEKMVKTRIPEIFEDYLGISDKYKSTLKTVDNKTPDDLLFDSLTEAYEIVYQIHEQQQNDKLNSMSIKNKYLKSKKM